MGELRRILRPSHGGTVGMVNYPLKNGGSLKWQYSHERDALYLLLFYAGVVSITTQSMVVTFTDTQGGERKAFPDFLVETMTGKIIVEVKDKTILLDPKEMQRLRSVAQACQENGYIYYLLTSDVIKAQPRLKNIKRVMHYRFFTLTSVHYTALRTLRETAEVWDLGQLSESMPDGSSAVYALVLAGRLRFDLDDKLKPITPFTILADSSEQFSHDDVLPHPLLKRPHHA